MTNFNSNHAQADGDAENPVLSYDQFVIKALQRNIREKSEYKMFLQACYDMLDRELVQLVTAVEVYIVVPSYVRETIAEAIVRDFNEAGGWNCELHWSVEEPYITFRSKPSEHIN